MKLNTINICCSIIVAIFCSVRSIGFKDETKPVSQIVGNYNNNAILSTNINGDVSASVQQRKSFRLLKFSLRGLGMSIRVIGDTIGGSLKKMYVLLFAIISRECYQFCRNFKCLHDEYWSIYQNYCEC